MSCSVFICLLYSKRKPCSQNKHTKLPSLRPSSTSLKDCMSGDFPFRQTTEQHWAPRVAEGLSVPSSTSVDPTGGVAPCTACYDRHACLFELQSKQNYQTVEPSVIFCIYLCGWLISLWDFVWRLCREWQAHERSETGGFGEPGPHHRADERVRNDLQWFLHGPHRSGHESQGKRSITWHIFHRFKALFFHSTFQGHVRCASAKQSPVCRQL